MMEQILLQSHLIHSITMKQSDLPSINLAKGREAGIPRAKYNSPELPHLINCFLGGSTAKDAAAETGISRPIVNRFIKSLRQKTLKCLYISGWEVSRGYTLPVYTLGYGQDRVKPKSYTPKERAQRYRDKKKMLNLIHLTAGAPKNKSEGG